MLADELAGYGPEVLVPEPPELRRKVVDRLRRSLADQVVPSMARTRTLQARDRLAVPLSLVPYLLDRGRVSVEEMARTSTSPRRRSAAPCGSSPSPAYRGDLAVPGQRPVRHQLGRSRGERPHRPDPAGRHRRLAALLGPRGGGAHRRGCSTWPPCPRIRATTGSPR
ncbi:hypothetical protein [Rathayibacter oskolensis]|uniref:hypothetical protein n=1 Tax=Rathayibacter oskolensis TaxID=1891671 RepID=UPI003F5D4DD8